MSAAGDIVALTSALTAFGYSPVYISGTVTAGATTLIPLGTGEAPSGTVDDAQLTTIATPGATAIPVFVQADGGADSNSWEAALQIGAGQVGGLNYAIVKLRDGEVIALRLQVDFYGVVQLSGFFNGNDGFGALIAWVGSPWTFAESGVNPSPLMQVAFINGQDDYGFMRCTANGRDYSVNPLTVPFDWRTDQGNWGSLTGSVVDINGSAVYLGSVVYVAAEPVVKQPSNGPTNAYAGRAYTVVARWSDNVEDGHQDYIQLVDEFGDFWLIRSVYTLLVSSSNAGGVGASPQVATGTQF